MAGEYFTREEAELLMKNINGNLGRIDDRLGKIEEKLDDLAGCVHGRVTYEALDRHKDAEAEIRGKADDALGADVEKLKRFVYIGIGILGALEVIGVPVLVAVLKIG